jgi:hypothetical protein
MYSYCNTPPTYSPSGHPRYSGTPPTRQGGNFFSSVTVTYFLFFSTSVVEVVKKTMLKVPAKVGGGKGKGKGRGKDRGS